MGFLTPKIPKPKLPPPTPSLQDASMFEVGRPKDNFTSLVSTSPQGLTTRANTAKRTLIGGAPSAT